ncbi:transcriptional regulator, MerR family [Cellulomonas flavigena DSM 20109]|uniref:Transcriptional regulator, MerR family n=1 Tax=Cellulomonas flavigena (strain ATCC 482 / DSM 20109 / BCRC 11376 / JCM 18109 / NBRC 3775 / NCIMB 8073 / NRS 134) TaxID=446466 RepID=D5UHR2_CELFN|nr:MerR family transcriptional regulator [Cellulomonas flavigena]ADG73336.1 transcriptional regulator, MerR family [Cellulomonas flavigena DSM 20109]
MTYRIAAAAELVGVPATTLRYYEDIGLIEPPTRGGNGYRTYDDADLARLRFITATKNLGIPLADVAELVKAYDVEDCSTVAHQVVEMVAQRLAETQTLIGELVALAAQLQTVAARLAEAPAAGPCGDGCPCATAAPAPLADRRTFVPLTRGPAPASDEPVIACSLDAGSVPDRISDWQALVARATLREHVAGGIALTFSASPALAAEVARLAAAEQDCCTFFTFTIQMTTGQVRLEVQAPPGAADVVAAMFGIAP